MLLVLLIRIFIYQFEIQATRPLQIRKEVWFRYVKLYLKNSPLKSILEGLSNKKLHHVGGRVD